MSGPILLTGGFGYVGGRLALALKAAGHDLKLTTRRRKEDFPSWSDGMAVVRITANDDRERDSLCRGIDTVLHLAGANEILSAADPERAFLDTALATLQLLRAATRQKVRRFVYLSTAHVYGAPLQGRIDEATLPRPIHPYAIAHKAAEDFVLAARDGGVLDGLVLRLSNGIGAPADARIDRWTLLGNDLCRQAVETGRLTLKSSGLQKRDFVALDDINRATIHLLTLPKKSWGDGLFNLGGGRSRSVLDIAEIVADQAKRILGKHPIVERPPPSRGETAPDLDYRIDKLAGTGFRPSGDLADELARTLIFCRDVFAGRAR